MMSEQALCCPGLPGCLANMGPLSILGLLTGPAQPTVISWIWNFKLKQKNNNIINKNTSHPEKALYPLIPNLQARNRRGRWKLTLSSHKGKHFKPENTLGASAEARGFPLNSK